MDVFFSFASLQVIRLRAVTNLLRHNQKVFVLSILAVQTDENVHFLDEVIIAFFQMFVIIYQADVSRILVSRL